MVVYYFYLSATDPTEFQIINLGLSSVPERMWIIAGVIITFFFGARELGKSRDRKNLAMSAEAFKEQQRRIAELRQAQEREAQKEHVASGTYAAEMADESEPISNRSIAEWNRRRGN